MSLAGALKRLVARRGKRNVRQQIVLQQVIERAAQPVVESLEGRRLLTTVALFPTIGVQGGPTPHTITAGQTVTSAADGTDYGNVDTKKNLVETFTIKNTGLGTLNLTAFNHVQVTGANAADFTVTSQPAATIFANGKTTFNLKFAPTTVGAETAVVTIYNDTDNADPFTFTVKGTGTAAPKAQIVGNGKIIPVNDTALSALDNTSFGSTETASGSISKTFTIKNLGSATMNLTGAKVAIGGADANDFTVATMPSATIASGASADFVIKFQPSTLGTAGVKNANVTVTTDDPTALNYKFNVTGTAASAAVAAVQGAGNIDIPTGTTTTSVAAGTDFGTADLVLNTVTKTFTIKDPGALGLTLNGNPIVSIAGDGKAAFTVVAQPANTVAAGGSLTFQIKFAPGSVGQKNATVSISNNATPGKPYTFAITGTAVSVPQIEVDGGSPATALTNGQTATGSTDGTDFGTADITGTTTTHVFSIKDLGSGALHLAGAHVAITGTDAADFILTGPADTTLAGKTTNRPAATPAKPAVAAAAYHRPAHGHHYHKGKVSHPHAVGATPNTTNFSIKFDPSVAKGAETATVTVTSDDATNGSFSFALAGNSVSSSILNVADSTGNTPIANGDVTPIVADGTDFGSADTSQTVVKTFTITNSGSQTLNFTGGAVLSDSTNFSIPSGQDIPSTLAVGASATFQVQFNPTAAGAQTSTVTLTSDDPASPYVFTVKGTGLNAAVEAITGNSNAIAAGQTTPAASNDTDFGNAELAQGFVTKTYTVNNTGSGALNITGITIAGTNKNDFTVTTQPSSPVAATSGTTTFVVKFRPTGTAAGVRNATITVKTNDAANPNYTFAVKGTAIRVPVMSVLGKGNAALATGDTTTQASDGTDFGNVNPTTQALQTYTIKNVGSDALNLSGPITFTGADAADFAIVTRPRVSIAAGASATFTVGFTPSGANVELATVNIASDDANTPYTFNVTGTGVAAPVLTVDGGSGGNVAITAGDTTPQVADGTDFGQAIINAGNSSNTFVLSNGGSAVLNVTSVALSGANAADFSIISQPSSTVAAGATSPFIVRFAPTVAGVRTATVTVTTDDSVHSTYTFTIKGTGITAPLMQVLGGPGTPSLIVNGESSPDVTVGTDFGDVELANGTVTQTFTIKDVGSAPLSLTGTTAKVTVSGANAGDFTIVTQPSATTPIAVNGTTTFQVKFKPTAVGQRNAVISIQSNDSTTSPYTFAVTGNAVQQPVLSVLGAGGKVLAGGSTAASVADGTDFGSAAAFTGTATKTFTIKNTGSAALNLSSLDVSGPDGADFTVTTQPAQTTLAVGASTTFVVTFAPTSSGAENAIVSIASDDPNGAFFFNIKGTAI